MTNQELRSEILSGARRYISERQRPPFVPGKTKISYSQHIYDFHEASNLIEVALDQWPTAGPWAEKFEEQMRGFFGARKFIMVNSGSSANLLMMQALRTVGYAKGTTVITPALGFPTTLAPIIQSGFIPHFIDVELDTYSPSAAAIENYVMMSGVMGIVFLPHALGLPFDATRLSQLKKWVLIEDGCDSLGATLNGKLVGTFGAMSSLSFFPAHHTTCGEGGGVVINSAKFTTLVQSLAQWGRSCFCLPGKANTCGKRFEWEYPLNTLPKGTDHKYCFDHIGYNFQVTEMQAAVMCAQFDKIEFIVNKRREHFWWLYGAIRAEGLENYFILPRVLPHADPSPYAFPMICRDGVSRTLPYRTVIASQAVS